MQKINKFNVKSREREKNGLKQKNIYSLQNDKYWTFFGGPCAFISGNTIL